ncbi:MAG TPA: carboxypeptidase-like regulatory domain-containing protein [Candidatus Acidoferrum sp.]|nr:carboxypeptidase-like regulatory domain-containing protein [Candidatus Acidoferrum sp.]
MNLRAMRVVGLSFFVCLLALPLASATYAGKISGLVVDPAGTPQMGASVVISSEQILAAKSIQVMTNDRGRFSAAALPAGLYSIQVTLAGFLPAIQQHVPIDDQHSTQLEIVLASVFSSFEKLRRQPDQPVSADDWTWVVRAAAANRSVLRWQDDPGLANAGQDAGSQTGSSHGLLELSSGADHPGSISDLADSPATAFVYDFDMGANSRLVMAGQYSHDDDAGAAGLVAEWLPSGQPGVGPVTTLLVRESQLGPEGPTFRGLRMSHDDQFAIGDRVSVRYGAEYLYAGFDGATTALRPRGEVAVEVSPTWQVAATIAAEPWQNASISGDALQSTLNALDAFPTLLIRNGHPVLENGFHEELSVKHELNKRADVTAAVFHDHSTHTAVIGRGGPISADFLQDYFSQAFAYDGGATASTGARLVYQETVTNDLRATVIYAYAGALAPNGDPAARGALREDLTTRYRQSLAAGVTAKLPRTGTKLTTSYKWLSGTTVSRLDPYGESVYNMDPYLSMEIRQPLPSPFPGHMEVQADVGNLLAQGYVPVATGDGCVVLVPSYRYFRGGLSLQF